MARREYPRVSAVHALKAGEPCEIDRHCVATHAVVVQVDWFRGNDDVYKVCDQRRRLARSSLRAFLNAYMLRQRRPTHTSEGETP